MPRSGSYHPLFTRTPVTTVWTASGTFTAPPSVTLVMVECFGGGGGGGGASGGGGGGGAYTVVYSLSVTPGNGYAVNVGAGGAGSTTNGSSGGASWFNSTGTVFAAGGGGGLVSAAGGLGGTASTGVGEAKGSGGTGGAGLPAANNGGGGGGCSGQGAFNVPSNGENGYDASVYYYGFGGQGFSQNVGEPPQILFQGGYGGEGAVAGENGSTGGTVGAGGGGGGSSPGAGAAGRSGAVALTYAMGLAPTKRIRRGLARSKGTAGAARICELPSATVGYWNFGDTTTLIKGGYDLNGSTQYFSKTTGTPPCVSGGNIQYPVSIITWFRLDTSATLQNLVRIDNNDTSLLDPGGIYTRVTSGNAVQAVSDFDGTESFATSNTSIGDVRWHCAIAVFSAHNARAVYTDIDTVGGTNTTVRTPFGPLTATWIGAGPTASGLTDGVIAYSAVLPVDLSGATQVGARSAIFNGEDPVQICGLSYLNLTSGGATGSVWKLDNDAGADAGPVGYNLSATAAPTAQNFVIVCRNQSGDFAAGNLSIATAPGETNLKSVFLAPTYSSTIGNGQGGAVFTRTGANTGTCMRGLTPIDSVNASTGADRPFQVYWAGRSTDSTNNQHIAGFVRTVSNDTEQMALRLHGAGAGKPAAWREIGAGTSRDATSATSYPINTDMFLWAAANNAFGRAIELNGTSLGTNGSGSAPQLMDRVCVGMCDDATPNAPHDGQTFFVMVVKSGANTLLEQSRVEQFVANNYNITIS